jgi:hypothetical protein
MTRAVLLAILCCLSGQAQITPLRVVSPQPRSAAISILSVRFQELKFGHEGPDYFAVDHAPYRGKQGIAEVTLHGQDAIRTVRFELLNQFGESIAAPIALRTGSGADSDEYLLSFEVPSQPFRFAIAGEDFRGQPYRRAGDDLIAPLTGSAPPPELIPGLSPDEAAGMRKMLDAYAAQTQAQFDAARKAHPDGVIRLPRSEVLEAGYDPLRSASGHEIGIRLHLAVRFGAEGDYSVAPTLIPQYKNTDWRQVSLKVLDARADPSPSSRNSDMLDDVLRHGGAAHYQGNQVYRFQFDLTPTYVIRNATKSRFCIYSEQFQAASHTALWQAIQDSDAPVKYRVSISSLDFLAETGEVPPQRDYLENFRRDGAGDCGPSPTNRF